jgi:hypothetical protein
VIVATALVLVAMVPWQVEFCQGLLVIVCHFYSYDVSLTGRVLKAGSVPK